MSRFLKLATQGDDVIAGFEFDVVIEPATVATWSTDDGNIFLDVSTISALIFNGDFCWFCFTETCAFLAEWVLLLVIVSTKRGFSVNESRPSRRQCK